MEHSFDVNLATEYGLAEAILFKNIVYWVMKNKANNQNYIDGKYWTYNSVKAFLELFPYLTEWQIKSAIKHLVNDGMIVKGEYNQNRYDKTSWYAIGKKGEKYLTNITEKTANRDNKGRKSNGEKQSTDVVKTSNRNNKNIQPIPDNKHRFKTTDINTYNKQERKKESTGTSSSKQPPSKISTAKLPPTSKKDIVSQQTYNQVIDSLIPDKNLNIAMKEHIKQRLLNKHKLTNYAVELACKKVMKMPENLRLTAVNNSIENGWKGIFLPKTESNYIQIVQSKQQTSQQRNRENLDEFQKTMDNFLKNSEVINDNERNSHALITDKASLTNFFHTRIN